MKVVTRVIIPILLLSVMLSACNRKSEQSIVERHTASGPLTKKEPVVVVPDSVKGKWKAVKIAVMNKKANKETIYTFPIGSEMGISGSRLTVKVENFLPQFMMEGTSLTSQSNEPKNPAAQIRVSEDGKEIFKGWLFSLYPTTHAFQHVDFGFTLVDFIPAN